MKNMKLIIAGGLILASCTSTNKVVDSGTSEADRNVAQAPSSQNQKRKYFIVQNVASEKTRVYEKCGLEPEVIPLERGIPNYDKAPDNCAHRLVFQTNNVVGRDKDGMVTDLGVQNIKNWVKFYETLPAYPSYYKSGYPEVPSGGFGQWTRKKAMPNGKGGMRGAFGWYAAILTPGANGQWSHGTVGRGSDGDEFIVKAHKSIATLFADLRSHGCVRHENRAIAYMQSILPEGTALIKIYAKEQLSDASLSRYQGQKSPLRWDWILTKEQADQENPYTSTAADVLARIGGNTDLILEQGSYNVDRYPAVQEWRPGKRAKGGNSGDSYDIGDGGMAGIFYVDEGRAVNYSHPRSLKVYGIDDYRHNNVNPFPQYMIKN